MTYLQLQHNELLLFESIQNNEILLYIIFNQYIVAKVETEMYIVPYVKVEAHHKKSFYKFILLEEN